MPTTVVLTFNQALDPARAQDASDYRMIDPKRRTIRVNSAVYNADTETMTSQPSQRINSHDIYTLIVDGTAPGGLENTTGQLLDGGDSGRPGSDFRTSLTWRNMFSIRHLPAPLGGTAQFHRTGRASLARLCPRCRKCDILRRAPLEQAARESEAIAIRYAASPARGILEMASVRKRQKS